MSVTIHGLVLLALLGTAAPASEDGDDVEDLAALLDSNVVSGASRTAERSDDAPATVTTVTAEDLQTYGIRSLDEAINFLSLGMFTQAQQTTSEIGARGVLFTGDYGNHMLVIVDGHPLNEPWDGTGYFEVGLGVPLALIDHVELIVGPGSVLYGSNAVLGVVNVVTRRAKDLGTLRLDAEGTLTPALDARAAPKLGTSGLGAAGRISAVGGGELELFGRPLELVVGLEYYALRGQSLDLALQTGLTETDGTRTWPMSFGPLAAPGTWGGTSDNWVSQVPTGIVKVHYGELDLWAKGTLFRRNCPYLQSWAADWNSDATYNLDRWLNLDLRWSHDLTDRVSASARGYLDLYDFTESYRESSWTSYGNGALDPSIDVEHFTFDAKNSAKTWVTGLELQSAVDWTGDGRLPLLAGVDAKVRRYRDEPANLDLSGGPLPSPAPYGSRERMIAPYVQQRARILPSLQLNVGARLDLQDGFSPHLSPRGALVWSLPWSGRVKASYSSAFRSPVGYERYATYDGDQIAHPDLRPETVSTFELTYEQRIGRHRLVAGGFYSRYEDMLAFVPAPANLAPNGESWFANSGSLENLGGNFLVEGVVGDLRYGAALTIAHNDMGGADLQVAPTWFGNGHAAYSFGEGAPSLAVAAFYAAPRLIDTADATGTDAAGNTVAWSGDKKAPAEIDLRATLVVPRTPLPGVGFRLAIGGAIGAWMPYTIGPRSAPDPATGALSPPLQPANDRLYVLGTLSFSLDAAAKERP